MTTPTRTRPRATGSLLVVVAVATLLVGLVLVFVAAEVLSDDEPVAEDVREQATEQAYQSVETGMTKEEIQQALLPARPIDVKVLAEYQLREPETPSASCSYYESEGGTADDLYRFCFVDDRLVDKTVVLPESDGVTGS